MSEQSQKAPTIGHMTVAQSREVVPIIPQSTDDIAKIAKFMLDAGALPKSYNGDAKKAAIAIMKGLEIGWLPMQAVQNMYVINGIPTIYGDGLVALARSSGLLEYCHEWIEGEGDAKTAYCEVKRVGEPKAETRSFSKPQAMKAGLLGKQGPWQTNQDRMMQMRARAFAIRDVFADALMGLRIKEEVEDYEIEEIPQPTLNPFANKVGAIDVEPEALAPKPAEIAAEPEIAEEIQEPDPGAQTSDPAKPFADHLDAISTCRDAIAEMKTAKDIDDYIAIWVDMVKESLTDCGDTLTTGKRMAATRKAELAKAKS